MINRIIIIFLVVASSSCQILPSKYEFNSRLITQSNGGLACENAAPNFYSESGGDEVITVKFENSLQFFDLRPEGNIYSDSAVGWSKLSYNHDDIYAVLSKPEKLKVGKTKALTGSQVCVTFYQGLFKDKELKLQNFDDLSGQQCCGTLTKKLIVRE